MSCLALCSVCFKLLQSRVRFSSFRTRWAHCAGGWAAATCWAAACGASRRPPARHRLARTPHVPEHRPPEGEWASVSVAAHPVPAGHASSESVLTGQALILPASRADVASRVCGRTECSLMVVGSPWVCAEWQLLHFTHLPLRLRAPLPRDAGDGPSPPPRQGGHPHLPMEFPDGMPACLWDASPGLPGRTAGRGTGPRCQLRHLVPPWSLAGACPYPLLPHRLARVCGGGGGRCVTSRMLPPTRESDTDSLSRLPCSGSVCGPRSHLRSRGSSTV